MSNDDDVKTDDPEVTDTTTTEVTDTEEYEAKAKLAKKRIEKKKKSGWFAHGMVKLGTAGILATSFAPSASAATPNDHEDGDKVTWVNGNPNEATCDVVLSDGKRLSDYGIGAQPASAPTQKKDLPTFRLERTSQATSGRTRTTATSRQQAQAGVDTRFSDPRVAEYAAKYEAANPGKFLVESPLNRYVNCYANPYTGHPGYCAILEEYDSKRPAMEPKFHCISNDPYMARNEVFTLGQVRTQAWRDRHLRCPCTFAIYGYNKAMAVFDAIHGAAHALDHAAHAIGHTVRVIKGAPAGPRRSPHGGHIH